jgi:hypothetical protein
MNLRAGTKGKERKAKNERQRTNHSVAHRL